LTIKGEKRGLSVNGKRPQTRKKNSGRGSGTVALPRLKIDDRSKQQKREGRRESIMVAYNTREKRTREPGNDVVKGFGGEGLTIEGAEWDGRCVFMQLRARRSNGKKKISLQGPLDQSAKRGRPPREV